MGEVFAQPQQPGRRLRRGFQHKHAGQHGKLRKVVGQVLLGQRDVLDGRQLDSGSYDRIASSNQKRIASLSRFTFGEQADFGRTEFSSCASCVAIVRLSASRSLVHIGRRESQPQSATAQLAHAARPGAARERVGGLGEIANYGL